MTAVTYFVQAYDATHRPIDVVPEVRSEAVTASGDPKTLLTFLHAYTSGIEPTTDRVRRVAYWQVTVEGSTAPGRIFITQYGRSCANAIRLIPHRVLRDCRPPEYLPQKPGRRPRCPRDCACDRHIQAARAHRAA